MIITMVLKPLDFNWGGVIQLIQQHLEGSYTLQKRLNKCKSNLMIHSCFGYLLILSILAMKLCTFSKLTGFDQCPSSLKYDPTIIAFAPRYCSMLPSFTPEPIKTGMFTASFTNCISFKLVASPVTFPVKTTPSERKNSDA